MLPLRKCCPFQRYHEPQLWVTHYKSRCHMDVKGTPNVVSFIGGMCTRAAPERVDMFHLNARRHVPPSYMVYFFYLIM